MTCKDKMIHLINHIKRYKEKMMKLRGKQEYQKLGYKKKRIGHKEYLDSMAHSKRRRINCQKKMRI